MSGIDTETKRKLREMGAVPRNASAWSSKEHHHAPPSELHSRCAADSPVLCGVPRAGVRKVKVSGAE